MIIQIKGNVKFPITLDPSVWIFDDRKIILEEAFNKKQMEENTEEFSGQDSNRIKPQVHNSIKKFNKNELLNNSYVMPIYDFVKNAEVNENASMVTLKSDNNSIDISVEQLLNGLLQFSIDGKQIVNEGPAYFYFKDGSNKDNPIKNVKEIYIH
ncbi:hypothetical protein SAMN04487944_11429 [Gracilibacillus ureilyticus]|uniref:Peptidyl-prolyl cis-trans isomerase n=1 Tax=Gracilibacillus ureilyticus TaxID=531814 RepID=A0A1H9TJ77_9BACI|nr:hypothetical protein [Gracilibacillus ureilyticus]SER97222.1 hypothetical protein SAMN04487944_11429 [Gracilibacillus ureilyticus]